jgi:hypothetical protein
VNRKIFHPLWIHIPALVSLALLVISIIISLPLPEEVPVHFSFNGTPNRYGSPWEALGITLGLSVFFILLSVFLDELWVRQEKVQKFNWFTLLDEIVVGSLTGFNIGYMVYLNSGNTLYSLSWSWLVLPGGMAMLAAVILEIMRPYRPNTGQLAGSESEELKAELARRLESNSLFIYWESQNPFYITLLTILLPFVLIIAAIFSWSSQPWASLILAGVGALLIIPNGGQRVIVKRDTVIIRWGIFGFRVLKLKMEEITAVELHEFSPLKDFGGYGIRFNREMKAYYMRGSLGVKLDTVNGKKYLIGSDNPENLLVVIKTILESR